MRRSLIALVVIALIVLGNLAWDQVSSKDECPKLKKVHAGGRTWCTHGEDPEPELHCLLPIEGCIIHPQPTVQPVPCVEGGSSGKRIHVFYAYVTTNDYTNDAPTIRSSAARADAHLFGQHGQHLRWLCDANNQLVVTPIRVAAVDLGAFITAARAAGHTRSDRVYTALFDEAGGGNGTIENDDRASVTNSNNTGPAYSVTRRKTSDGTLLHELGHNLGAVQLSAPHTSGAWHCYDEHDLMCYDDNGPYFRNGGQLQTFCPDATTDWDCRRDDYHNRTPAAGSYLATRWNLAWSGWMEPAGTPLDSPTPTCHPPNSKKCRR